jgi:hypothetical protein
MKIKFQDGTEKEFADLHDADLRGADLRFADLHGADLRGADLSVANLSGAHLSGANLRYANLRVAHLRGADLHGADLRSADLRGADLHGADLRGANLDYSCWPLWCGSLSPKIDKGLACQLLYHTMMAMRGCDDSEVKEFLGNNQAIALANKFHRADEFGKILKQEVL